MIIDVVLGCGGGFSLEVFEGVCFFSRGWVFSDVEKVMWEVVLVIIGVVYECGE